MTTLAQNASDSDSVIVVTPGSEQDNGFHFRVDDEIVTFLGYDRDSTADIQAYLDGDRTRWRVRRGQEGTTAAAHLSGATLYAVVPAWSTGDDLDAPSPFAGGAPTLADVLAEGNDPDGTPITAAAGAAGNGAGIDILPGDANAGGSVNVSGGAGITAKPGGNPSLLGGTGDDGNDVGAAISAEGGWGDGTPGAVVITTRDTSGASSTGAPGDVLQAIEGYAVGWGRIPNSAELVITEDASGAAGTYSGSITVPGGATITGLYWSKVRDFNQAATLIIGDSDDPDGFVTGGEVNSYPDGKTANVFASAYPFDVSDAGDYVTVTASMVKALYSATDHDIDVLVTVADPTDPAPVDLGEVRVLVTWSLPPSSAATFEAAA